MARHKLTDKNLDTMTATCSVDGPVSLHRSGQDVRCAVASRSGQQRWARLNPDKAKAGRAKVSPHRLTSKDFTTLTGECPVCGTVGIVAKGRGYMCRNRALELWTTQQAEPQRRCGRCVKVFLSADGTCRYCDDTEALSLGASIKATEDLNSRRSLAPQKGFGRVVDTSLGEVEVRMEPLDTRVDGWRTLGSGVPEGVNPRHFVTDWWAAYAHLAEDT